MIRNTTAALTLLVATGFTSHLIAADKYWSGSGTWNTTSTNWSLTPGGPYDQQWSNGDNAIFEGTAGTVTVAEVISVSRVTITENDYVVTGNRLSFAPGGTITNLGLGVTISSGIVGQPDVYASHPNGFGGPYGTTGFELSPDGEDMHIGTLFRPVDNYMAISGTTTSNTIAQIPKGNRNNKMRWQGPGTWSVAGEAYCGEFYVNGGTLITGGRTYTDYRNISTAPGATLIANGTLEDFTYRSSLGVGGTLGGTGVIELAIDVPATGALAPGHPTGLLTITNSNCSITGSLDVAVNGNLHSRLHVDGSLTLTNATLNVTAIATPAQAFVIATYDSLNGTFGTLNLPRADWDVEYGYQGANQIAVIPPARGTVIILQ